jgi:hypothetical protein
MVQFNHALGGGSSHPADAHEHRRQRAQPNDTDSTISDEPASIQVAEAVAEPIVGRQLTEREKTVGGSVAHYAFGALVGAMYGAAAETRPSTAAGGGVPFGVSVWLGADELGLPAVGLAAAPQNYPLSRHAAAFASHVVFGVTVECVRRMLRGRPQQRFA